MSTTPTTQDTLGPPMTAGRTPGGNPQRIARLFEKLPPHAIEAEMCLLGSILLEPRELGDITLIIRDGEDFYKPANGAIYDAMVELYDAHASLDVVQLNQVLVDRDVLDAVGGQDYLVELASCVPSAANAGHYARLVREKAMVRRLIEQAGEILHEAFHSRDDAATILDQAEHRIFSIAERYEHSEVETLGRLVQEVVARLQASDGRQVSGALSGFAGLDELTGGFQQGDFIIIAGRPSMGKTALALNVAENMAMRGDGVGIFSLEMSKHHLVERLLASRSGLELHRLRRMMLGKEHYSRLFAACGDLQDAPIYVDDLAASTLLQIRARARRMVAKHAVKAIFIDYIQLITVGARVESRQVEVSAISRGLKALARELNLPVICMSQLNRAPEQREGHKPRLSDLRESGSLEQDADVVALLHREDYYHLGEKNYEPTCTADLIIAKQRNGPTGAVKLSWIEQSTRFKDYSPAVGAGEYAGSIGPAAPVEVGAELPI
ncbi:MAG: replicative DNA helicase [Planctomycetota bacterium]|nr:replicative DNA helicase [Planctomycetota bacterium]